MKYLHSLWKQLTVSCKVRI